MLDQETGEIVEQTLKHEAGTVREFYAALPAPVVVGLEATGSMGWFLQLLDELGITYRVGHPATIRKAEKHCAREEARRLRLRADRAGTDPGGGAQGRSSLAPASERGDPVCRGTSLKRVRGGN
jgi:transposase